MDIVIRRYGYLLALFWLYIDRGHNLTVSPMAFETRLRSTFDIGYFGWVTCPKLLFWRSSYTIGAVETADFAL